MDTLTHNITQITVLCEQILKKVWIKGYDAERTPYITKNKLFDFGIDT